MKSNGGYNLLAMMRHAGLSGPAMADLINVRPVRINALIMGHAKPTHEEMKAIEEVFRSRNITKDAALKRYTTDQAAAPTSLSRHQSNRTAARLRELISLGFTCDAIAAGLGFEGKGDWVKAVADNHVDAPDWLSERLAFYSPNRGGITGKTIEESATDTLDAMREMDNKLWSNPAFSRPGYTDGLSMISTPRPTGTKGLTMDAIHEAEDQEYGERLRQHYKGRPSQFGR